MPLNKILKPDNLTINVRSVFQEEKKFYPQVLLDKLDVYMNYQVLEYDKIDISERIDIKKTNASKEFDIGHYWYFLDEGFNYEPHLCNGCHDLMQKSYEF